MTGFVRSVDHHQNGFEKCKNCSGVGLQVSKFNVTDFFKNASSYNSLLLTGVSYSLT